MKKGLSIISIIIVITIIYTIVNFLFFDKWAFYSCEKQLNTYIKNDDTKKLSQISKDNKTYKLLRKQDKISIEGKADNQGSGNVGYYPIDINGKSATLTIQIKHGFLPEKPNIKSIKLDK